MHTLSFGISKHLKQCLSNYLSNGERRLKSISYTSGAEKPFHSIRRLVLGQNRCFLREPELIFPGFGLKSDFLKEVSGDRLSGVYNETGLLGMLKSADFEFIDLISSFIGAIVDISWGNVNNALETKVITEYCKLLRAIYRRELNIRWTKSELQSLKRTIKKLKDYSRNVFEAYHVSGMRTFKWHCLEHVVDTLKVDCGLEHLHSVYYEKAQKIFQRRCKETTRQNRSRMKETLKLLMFQSSLSTNSVSSEFKSVLLIQSVSFLYVKKHVSHKI